MDAWPGRLPAPSRRQRLGIQMLRWKWRAKDASAAGRARCHGDTVAKPGEKRTRTGMDWEPLEPREPQEPRDRGTGPSSAQLNPPGSGVAPGRQDQMPALHHTSSRDWGCPGGRGQRRGFLESVRALNRKVETWGFSYGCRAPGWLHEVPHHGPRPCSLDRGTRQENRAARL